MFLLGRWFFGVGGRERFFLGGFFMGLHFL